jgi:hypothetical protein
VQWGGNIIGATPGCGYVFAIIGGAVGSIISDIFINPVYVGPVPDLRPPWQKLPDKPISWPSIPQTPNPRLQPFPVLY